MFPRQAFFCFFCSLLAVTTAFADKEIPHNPSITRVSEGRYENRDAAGGTLLGTETFRLTVHSDGSRCLLIWSNSASRGTQITSQVCTDAAFRPTEAFARYWIGGRFRGSGWISVKGSTLTLTSSNAAGDLTTTRTTVPERFSIGTHPISGDAWHVAALGDSHGDTATAFVLNPAGTASEPLLGSLTSIPIQRLGQDEVEVPAGRFPTRKLKLSGQSLYWATEKDWLVVKSSTANSVRVLIEFREID